MWEEKQQLVVDTSVCIDLFNGGILDAVAKLPYYFLLPDVIMAGELKEPPGKKFTDLGFIAAGTTGDEMRVVEELSVKYRQPSRNDLFALTIAKSRRLLLLSGDKALRNPAAREKAEVNGIIWILDHLISESVMSAGAAADALVKIRDRGAWLPEKECTERLRKWRS